MLELKNICYTVSTPETGEQTILKDISVTIPDGKLIVFTGPNGGGKTTLAKVIMGLVTPTSGQILWNGEDITALDITARAKRRHQLRLPAAPALQGHHRARPAHHRQRRQQAQQGQVLPLPHAGRPMRERLSRPRSGRLPLGRRGQAHRDRDAARASFRADDLRRARGRHRPVELRPSDRDL